MQCSLDDLKSQATVRLSKTWTHDVVCRAGPTTTIVPTWTEPVFLAKKVCMRIVMLDEHRQEVSVQGEVTPPIHRSLSQRWQRVGVGDVVRVIASHSSCRPKKWNQDMTRRYDGSRTREGSSDVRYSKEAERNTTKREAILPIDLGDTDDIQLSNHENENLIETTSTWNQSFISTNRQSHTGQAGEEATAPCPCCHICSLKTRKTKTTTKLLKLYEAA